MFDFFFFILLIFILEYISFINYVPNFLTLEARKMPDS